MPTSRFSPAVVLATLGLLVSGCSSTAPAPTPVEPTPTEPEAMQQVPDAMVASSAAMSSVEAMQAMTAAYKDGTYTVVGTYKSPAGPESINVTVTLADDVVTNVDYAGTAENPISQKRQADFAGGFKTLVVGKKLNDIQLVAVSGASLTTNGFMDALAKVKVEAKQ
jgi:uncharacterized protein with FMN-binding domain